MQGNNRLNRHVFPAIRCNIGPADRSAARLVAPGLAIVALLGASPALAQSFRSPFSQDVDGNQQHLILVPTLDTVYDTNVLRFNRQGNGGSRDNLRVTPGAALSLNRIFGRTQVRVSASGGYDFNSRYKFLDRARIDAAGGLTFPVGAICTVSGDARYEQFQFDQADLTQAVIGRVIGATSRVQTYNGNFGCQRASGFSPVGGVSYRKLTSNQFAVFDYRSFSYRGGVAYAQPSLGTLTLMYTGTRLRRSRVSDILGIDDGTDVKQVDLSLSRAVSPRVRMQVGGGFVHANPARPGVKSFFGISFNGDVSVLLAPRFVLNFTASRDVSNENGISATYVVRDDYRAALNWKLTAKSTIQLAAARSNRRFRGEDLLLIGRAIGRDATNIVSLDYGYDTLRNLNFRAGVSQRWRNSRNDFYDYHATVVSASVGARF